MSEGVVFGTDTARKLYELVKPGSDPPERKPPASQPQRDPGEAYIFRNDSGETVPAFGCMRVTDAETDANRYVIVIGKPNSTGGPFVFNGPREVADGEYGIAFSGIVKAYFTTGTPAVGEVWGPNSGWSVESGGDAAITVYGPIESDVILGSTSGSGSSGGCPSELPDIIDAADADYVQVIRMVDGAPTCVLAELQGVICGSDPSGPSGPSGSNPSGSIPSSGFSDCLSEWGSDCIPDSSDIVSQGSA